MKRSVKDFYTKTRNEKSTKMPLLFDGEDTGVYLMVKGIEARSVADARFNSQIEYALMTEKADATTSVADQRKFRADKSEEIKIDLAVALITGWSFEEEFNAGSIAELLAENAGLSDSVIAHSSTATNYFAKK